MSLLKWMAPATALAGIALVAPLPTVEASNASVGDDAHEFGIEEAIANVPDGTEFSLEAFEGKVVMVEFFTTW